MQTLQLNGIEYVIIEKVKYDRLARMSDAEASRQPGVTEAIPFMRGVVADRLKAAIKKAGWSQADLAAKAKVAPETISRIMSRKHTADASTWHKIDRALRKAGITA